MGSATVYEYGYGKTMQEAFRSAQETAEEEYGRDNYNGQINNCYLVGDKTSKFKGNIDKAEEYANEMLGKREVIGICLEAPKANKNKTKSQVENFPQKGARKFETRYVAENWDGREVVNERTQGAAIKAARKYVEENSGDPYNNSLTICVTKRLVDGNSKVAEIKYKPSKDEKAGKYLFLGWAPD